jgi:hypothetical protein
MSDEDMKAAAVRVSRRRCTFGRTFSANDPARVHTMLGPNTGTGT